MKKLLSMLLTLSFICFLHGANNTRPINTYQDQYLFDTDITMIDVVCFTQGTKKPLGVLTMGLSENILETFSLLYFFAHIEDILDQSDTHHYHDIQSFGVFDRKIFLKNDSPLFNDPEKALKMEGIKYEDLEWPMFSKQKNEPLKNFVTKENKYGLILLFALTKV
ncbi:MAG: hypothetical protein AAF380_01670 [Bacteroidota bacterium]